MLFMTEAAPSAAREYQAKTWPGVCYWRGNAGVLVGPHSWIYHSPYCWGKWLSRWGCSSDAPGAPADTTPLYAIWADLCWLKLLVSSAGFQLKSGYWGWIKLLGLSKKGKCGRRGGGAALSLPPPWPVIQAQLERVVSRGGQVNLWRYQTLSWTAE